MSLFPTNDRDIREYSPALLAYLGDAVLELYIRSLLVAQGPRPVKNLHKSAVSLVSAVNQARVVEGLKEILTEEEKEVLRRGRNTKDSGLRRGNSRDHALSTGLEAVLGYLFLKGDEERLKQILTAFVRLS